ncbi:hypothetical protein AXK12_06280 [Cephaloticoccus capnophilus]|uniref:histidine kinase n=1 Tax=Cephaloticoccus capnophilus TaxID=1548208 RepID=A0A139SK84_9BACT|nr:HAMP domain-containing sensor histidine kinase [Cephaloticoccus capnophilus]KXU34971.1 hypothetical protein AXK12_06280 [Cephaloticoccus capnophilus]
MSAFPTTPPTAPTPSTLDEALRLLEAERARSQSDRLEAVARFASMAVHDYNNLLSVINGYCEMLAPELEPQPEIAAQVAEIHKAGKKAVELSRLLMGLSGKQSFEPQTVDLNSLVQEQRSYLTGLVAISRASLHVEAASPEPCRVQTDTEQFKQALHHLVANARDAVSGQAKGEVVLKIELRTGECSNTQAVALSIVDNGTGIDESVHARLFEPFFTTKRTGKGVGLGLFFVDSVVKRSGGTITARNAAPQGAIFEIVLPLVTAGSANPANGEAA